MTSFECFPRVSVLIADVSEHCIGSIFKGRSMKAVLIADVSEHCISSIFKGRSMKAVLIADVSEHCIGPSKAGQ
jgi:hypothetical protein